MRRTQPGARQAGELGGEAAERGCPLLHHLRRRTDLGHGEIALIPSRPGSRSSAWSTTRWSKWLGRGFLQTFLFQTSAADPLTYLAVCLGIFAVALLAALGPAVAAAEISPSRALAER